MNLFDAIYLLRKWLWAVILVALVNGGAIYVIRDRQPPTYTAHVVISVGGYIQSPNPDTSQIRAGVELAYTYAALATTHDVLTASVDAADFPLPPDQLRPLISTYIVPNTSLLKLSVTYTDPILAADIANEIAAQLILKSAMNLTPAQQGQYGIALDQIDKLTEQLGEIQVQLDEIDQQLADEDLDTITRRQLLEQQNWLITQTNQVTTNLAQFISISAGLQEHTNSLGIFERAHAPSHPNSSQKITLALLGGILSAVLLTGVILLVEHLADTIYAPQEVGALLARPVLSVIPKFGKAWDRHPKRLITLTAPDSLASGMYRTLRANLLFADDESAQKIYVVTSPGPKEGKSVTTANLAVTMAKANLQVLLIDANMQHPALHRIFGLDNNKEGLSKLLTAYTQSAENGDQPTEAYQKYIQDTAVPGLRVITSGDYSPKAVELMGTAPMQKLTQELRKADDIDVVLFDTAQVLGVPDSTVLTATAGASVILVSRARRTSRQSILSVADQLTNLDLAVKGVVVNCGRSYDSDFRLTRASYHPLKPSAVSRGDGGIAKHLYGNSQNYPKIWDSANDR
jgi:capsular exopolysaccharide synthesis family protein